MIRKIIKLNIYCFKECFNITQFNKTNVAECVYYTNVRVKFGFFFYIIRSIWKLYFTTNHSIKKLCFLTK